MGKIKALPYSTVALPDGIVIGGPWPHTIISWPGGKSRGATKPEYDLFQALERAHAEIEAMRAQMPNDQDQPLLRYANETPELLSLLYDMDLMPEQLKERTHDWARMLMLIQAWKNRTQWPNASATKPKTIDFDLYANLRHQYDLVLAENQKIRRIATHVPAKIYIKATEKAGYGVPVTPNDKAH